MTDDLLEIPAFLDRRLNGIKLDRRPIAIRPSPVLPSTWATLEERGKQKARGRIAKMKTRMADRAALDAGKTWDVVRGGWR